MKRSTVMNFLAAAAMFGSVNANAQVWQNWYAIGNPPPGTDYKPGRARAIITDEDKKVYVTAGTAVNGNNLEAFTMAFYDIFGSYGGPGTNVVTRFYEPNHNEFEKCYGNDVVKIEDGYAMVGYMTGPAGSLSMVIRTNPDGDCVWQHPTNKFEAKAVAYNPDLQHIAVLGQEYDGSGASLDFYLQVFDIWGGVVSPPSGVNIFGTKYDDQPYGLYYDREKKQYVMTGVTYVDNGDEQVLTMTVDSDLNWQWGFTYGHPGLREVGRAVTLAADDKNYVITGYKYDNEVEPIFMELEYNTGKVVTDPVYYSYHNPNTKDNYAHSITVNKTGTKGEYYIAGMNEFQNTNGFLLRVRKDGIGYWYTFYGGMFQPGNEEFYDITNSPWEPFGLVGDHEYSGGSGTLFPWVVSTDAEGRANCYEEVDVKTVRNEFEMKDASPSNHRDPDCCYDLKCEKGEAKDIDECHYPYKSGERSIGELKTVGSELVAPQPASDKVTLHYDLAQGSSASWVLRDVLGKVVMTQELTAGSREMTVDVSKLESGVYFYEYVVNGNIGAQNKLIIAR